MYDLLQLPRPWHLEMDAQILKKPDLLYVRLRNTAAILRCELTVRVVDQELKVDGEDCHGCRMVAPGDRFAWVWPLAQRPPEKDHVLLEVRLADGGKKTVLVPLSCG